MDYGNPKQSKKYASHPRNLKESDHEQSNSNVIDRTIQAPVIFKFDFNFEPDDTGISPRQVPYGHIFRAKFFDWMKNVDPSLVERFHNYKQTPENMAIRPYSIGRRVQYAKKQPERKEFNQNSNTRAESSSSLEIKKIIFALNIFDKSLGQRFAQYVLKEAIGKVNFGPHSYAMTEVNIQKIRLDRFLEETRPVIKLRVEFLTPTTFRSLKHNFDYRFPEPVNFFTNLAHIWNEFFPNVVSVDEIELRHWVKTHVMVSSYDLRTIPVDIGKKKKIVGFEGWCTFLVRGIDSTGGGSNDVEWCCWLDRLGRLAEITNVGHNRTAAMGSCKVNRLEFLREYKNGIGTPTA